MKLLHNILRGSTLATALFIFQSCYGMPQSLNESVMYEATIKVTDNTGKALEGVRLSGKNIDMADFCQQVATGADGMLTLSVAVPLSNPVLDLRFEADGFAVKDTTIKDVMNPEPDFTVKLEAE